MVSRFIENKHIDYFPQIASKCHQIYNSIDVDYYENLLFLHTVKKDIICIWDGFLMKRVLKL